MTPERWRRIETLFHDVRERPDAEREEFLVAACRGDPALHDEVAALLRQQDGSLLRGGGARAVADVLGADALPQTGRVVGPYVLETLIGVGGMGEVYRAHDRKLGRDVAVKILPRFLALDPDRLARFEREARILASLNHPHIEAIYGLQESEGVRGLVLELVEGDTLAERVARGPFTTAAAVAIARQIADALDAAHEAGIVHRDLKPANIKITPDGVVKVLDFGLAKVSAGDASHDPRLMPMIPAGPTREGAVVGTPAYMSPEQARGQPVDKRTDIWAFGCVLYEMLTGRPAFDGATASDTIAALLERDPDWTALPRETPAPIRRLLEHCLEKDRKRRLRDIGEARFDEASDPAPSPAASRSAWSPVLPWVLAALLCIALAIAGVVAWRGVGRDLPAPVYASLDAPAGYVLGTDNVMEALPTHTPMVFTPDGRSLVIQAARAHRPQLFLRSLDRPDARPIAGTEGAGVPFVSPDGKWVGFWSANEIRKVPIEGGAATTICAARAPLGPYGAAWGSGDVIAFGDFATGRIMRVAAGGGTPAPVTAQPPAGRRHVSPWFLPDGQRILFSDVSQIDAADSRLMVQTLHRDDVRTVIGSASDGRLLPSGHLAFMRLGTLMTVRFDPARAETNGDAVIAARGVMQSGLRGLHGAENTGVGMFAVSSRGSLAVIPGALTGPDADLLIWVTRDGRPSSAEPASGAPRGGRGFWRISPDGSRAVVLVRTSMRDDLWLVDWTRDAWAVCTECKSDYLGVWSPDGTRLLLGTSDTLVAHAVDGSVPDRVLVRETGRQLWPGGWLADGRIVYQSSVDEARYEIKLLERGATSGLVVVPLGMGESPEVSPDGHWLAYDSTKTREVEVQAFPGPGSRTQVSAGVGSNPTWSADGRTLYYLRRTETGGSAVVAVDIITSSGLAAGKPRELFRRPEGQRCNPVRCFDVSADGQRFLMWDKTTAPNASVTRMDLVLNWAATLPDGR